jgi:glycosyltransferase involved in cell wall biosynthesis
VLHVAANATPSTLPNVKVLGQQPRAKMADLIGNAACVIVPSVWKENCPMIIIEALRAGVPIVASRIGGIPELIEEGVTGMLVTPGDAEELAMTIRLCCEDEQLRASARQAGPATVRDRFSREVMVTTLERLYAA